jgi:hypothetical protein
MLKFQHTNHPLNGVAMLPWRMRLAAAAVAAVLVPGATIGAQQPRTGWERAEVMLGGYRGVMYLSYGVRFTADLRDVASADSGAQVVVTMMMRDGSTRRVQVEGGPGGRLERTYRVAGVPAPYDSAAARWLHLAVAQVVPHTVPFRRAYVHRLLREQGLDSLLAQISRSPRQRTDMPWYSDLVADSSLTPAEFARVLQSAVRGLPRERQRSSFLSQASWSPLASRDDSVSAQVIAATDSVPQEERIDLLRRAAMEMGAGYPLSRAAWFQVLRGLEFDDQRIRALFSAVAGWGAPFMAAEAVRFAGGLARPADRARVLLAVADARLRDPLVRAAYEQVLAALPAGPERDAAATHLQHALSSPSQAAPSRPAAPSPGGTP